jgi:hypothetical protein
MTKGVVWVILFASIAVVLVVWAWTRYLTAKAKAKAELTGGKEYRGLSEEYRRLADMAVTSQEHTELKLGDLAVQMAQLRDQLESVQRILKDVE